MYKFKIADFFDSKQKFAQKNRGSATFDEVLQYNEARQQLMRRNAAKPGLPRRSNAKTGQGRERMRGQFAGYIPANRAEKFREAERS